MRHSRIVSSSPALVGSTLTVTDGPANDVVLFAPSPAGDVMVNDNGAVTVWPAASVAQITVRVAGGNDVVDAGPFIHKPMNIYGGPGNDQLMGSAAGDMIYGEAGDDFIAGRAGSDYCFGGFGNDTLRGDLGVDWLYGEDGDDWFVADDGALDGIVDGGPGVDGGVFDWMDPVVL